MVLLLSARQSRFFYEFERFTFYRICIAKVLIKDSLLKSSVLKNYANLDVPNSTLGTPPQEQTIILNSVAGSQKEF